MELVLDVAATGNRNFPFGFMQMEQRKVTVNAGEIPINVLALPGEGKPASFSGAVGDFTISASLNESEVRVGDPLAVDVMIEGQGNFDAIEAPKLSPPMGWKVYPPKRYNVDTGDPNTADLINRKLGFNQILVPEKVVAEVPPFEFSFFSPRIKQYVTLRSQPLPVTILPFRQPRGTCGGDRRHVQPHCSESRDTAPGSRHHRYLDAGGVDTALGGSDDPAAFRPALSDRKCRLCRIVSGLGRVVALAARSAESDGVCEAVDAAATGGSRAGRLVREGILPPCRRVCGNWRRATKLSPEALSILERYETVNFTPGRPEAATVPTEERSRVLGLLRQLKTASGTPPALPSTAVVTALAVPMLAGSAQAAPQDLYVAAAQALEKGDYAAAEKAASALVAEGQVGPELFTLLRPCELQARQARPGGHVV